MRRMGWRLAVAGVVLGLAAGAAHAEADSGLYRKDGVYRVETFEALCELSELVASGEGTFTGEVWLTEDIEAEGILQPIGSPERMFLGTFDGRGHSISGLRMEGCSEFSGLFGYVGRGGCVKNLTVSGSLVMGSRYAGIIAAYNAGTIENCRAEGSCTVGTGQAEFSCAVGGIAGISVGNIADCVNENSCVVGRRNVGGIVGSLCEGRVERCVSTGCVFSWDEGQALAGGVAGGVQTSGQAVGCISAGRVEAPDGEWVGGVVGGLMSGEMKRCLSFSEVSGRSAGSAVGYVARRAQVMACYYERGRAVGEGKEDGVYRMTSGSGFLRDSLLEMVLGK